jgi:VWFA-related protein
VLNLTADDFDVRDNGVPQKIGSIALRELPFDLTLVVDTSGSLTDRLLAQFRTDITRIGAMLGKDDRFRLITFATRTTDAFGWRPASDALPVARLAPGGATAFYHALAAALLQRPGPGRRQLILAMSDGYDNVSILDTQDLRDLARSADAVLHIVLRRDAVLQSSWGWVPYRGAGNVEGLKDAAESTGGRLRTTTATESLTDAFKTALDEFRTGYLIWFTPEGVAPTGWHSLTVRVKRGNPTIRARSGYDAGGSAR